jgi:hypothetical protein
VVVSSSNVPASIEFDELSDALALDLILFLLLMIFDDDISAFVSVSAVFGNAEDDDR